MTGGDLAAAFGALCVASAPLLKAVGLILAAVALHHHGRRQCFDFRRFHSFLVWTGLGALVGGHLAQELLYHPSEIVDRVNGHFYWNQPLALLRVWDGWRPIGGLCGATLGALLWHSFEFKSTTWLRLSMHVEIEGHWFVRRSRPEPVLAFADAVASAFPLAWGFRELALALTHDRLGVGAPASALLAVRTLDSMASTSAAVFRYDLALIDLVAVIFLSAIFALWSRSNPRTGYRLVYWLLGYAIVRFAIEFLKRVHGPEAEPRYWHLTPAQWGCAVLCTFGAILGYSISRSPRAASSTAC